MKCHQHPDIEFTYVAAFGVTYCHKCMQETNTKPKMTAIV